MNVRTYLGIDPGFADMGYGVIEIHGGDARCIAFGSVTTPKGLPAPVRLKTIYRELGRLIDEHRPDAAAVERLYFAKNAKTAMDVAEARGVIRLCIEDKSVPAVEFSPNAVKLAVCGHGGADKREMQKMVKTLLSLTEIPRPDDAADALALALALAYTKRFEPAAGADVAAR